MLRVGLSGGIGSGKSTVASRLAARGAFVVDSDRVAREVLAPGTPGLARVRDRFGSAVIDSDGALDRPALGEVVFADESARADLEAITHPLIERRTADLVAMAGPDDVVVHDVPLLVEKRMGPAYHLVVVVHAPEQERRRRLTAERGMSPESARSRIRSQAGDAARRRAADVWLDNTATEESLTEQVDRLWDERLVPYERNVRLRTPSRQPEHLTLVPADPHWPARAARLIARLQHAWGVDAPEADIAHIGSTAIEGMPATDVIDLQMVVADVGCLHEPATRARLDAGGWVLEPGPWWDEGHGDDAAAQWRTAMVLGTDPGQVVHLHVRPRGSPAARRALLFRDWMKASVEARAEYAALKDELQQRHLDVTSYARAREPWFAAAFTRAEAWAERTLWEPDAGYS